MENELQQAITFVNEGLIEAVKFVDAEKDPSERVYLLIYKYEDENGEEIKTFEIIKGRQELYEYIKGMVEYIDLVESFVIAENVKFKDAVNVYQFMKYMKENKLVNDDTSFSVDDYYVPEYIDMDDDNE